MPLLIPEARRFCRIRRSDGPGKHCLSRRQGFIWFFPALTDSRTIEEKASEDVKR